MLQWFFEFQKHHVRKKKKVDVGANPTPLWQLVWRISGRKRMGPRLVAALKDVDGRVISTLEAAAAVWERKCLEASSCSA